MEVFDALPLAAVVHADFGDFFCVHGGIGPDVPKLRDIKKIDRFLFFHFLYHIHSSVIK